MNWVDGQSSDFEQLLAGRPVLSQKYQAFLGAIEACEDIPARVLELCRARIQQIHGQTPVGINSDEARLLASQQIGTFSEAEQAALVAAERVPYQHHLMQDEEVAAIRMAFGEAGCVALLTALAFFDVTCRLNATIKGET